MRVKDWRKSTHSGGESNDCVELASDSGIVAVRDTKNRDGGTLALSAAAWQEFLARIA